jgi:hypothetical protein
MAQKHRFRHQKRHNMPSPAPRTAAPPEAPRVYEKKAPVTYGKPFIVMEDAEKNTFEFKGGAWIPHGMSIAECRRDCKVTELSQKVNGMTRYEIRAPVAGKA